MEVLDFFKSLLSPPQVEEVKFGSDEFDQLAINDKLSLILRNNCSEDS